MGLLGPTEIVAHPLTPGLVVMNGCHSAQGETLPGAGLMGLTRAWIAAGARAVLATAWDIPDEAGKTMMVRFYQRFRKHPERGSGVCAATGAIRYVEKQRNGKPGLSGERIPFWDGNNANVNDTFQIAGDGQPAGSSCRRRTARGRFRCPTGRSLSAGYNRGIPPRWRVYSGSLPEASVTFSSEISAGRTGRQSSRFFVIVTQAIQNGDLREPERLMGYVRTVVKRQMRR